MSDTYKLDKFEHFENCWIEEVVSPIIANKGVDHGGKEVTLYDVAIVELIFQGNNFAHEAECVCKKR